MKHLTRYLAVLFAVLTLCATESAMAAVTASLDRDQIAPDETVQLLVQREGSSNGQPDLSGLKRDFDILRTSQGSSVRIINGHVNSSTEIKLTLAPKHEGTIRIAPLQWDGEQSPPLTLTVGGSGSANAGAGNAQTPGATSTDPATAPAANAHVFLTATLDRPQTYVQAATVLTVRVHTDQTLYQAGLNLTGNADVIVKPLGKDVQSSESLNGRDYQVIERKYLLFPQRNGQLRLDGAVLDAQVADTNSNDLFGNAFGQLPGMMRSTRPLRLHAKAVELKVLPRPAAATGSVWLPAEALVLTENWRPDNAPIHVGEPLTRELHLAASGLTGAQLPDLSALMPLPEGFKSYPDQAQLNDTAQGNTVLGRRDQSIALIASQPGRYTLPALRLNWWNTQLEKQEELVLPERTLEILPAVAGSISPAKPSTALSPAPMPSVTQAPTALEAQGPLPSRAAQAPWMWISLGLGVLWLLTVLAWWYARRRRPAATATAQSNEASAATSSVRSTMPAGKAAKAFAEACRNNDPQVARTALIDWTSATWPEQSIAGLHDVVRLLDDPQHEAALKALNRACYTDTPWAGESLSRLALNRPQRASATKSETALPGLYP